MCVFIFDIVFHTDSNSKPDDNFTVFDRFNVIALTMSIQQHFHTDFIHWTISTIDSTEHYRHWLQQCQLNIQYKQPIENVISLVVIILLWLLFSFKNMKPNVPFLLQKFIVCFHSFFGVLFSLVIFHTNTHPIISKFQSSAIRLVGLFVLFVTQMNSLKKFQFKNTRNQFLWFFSPTNWIGSISHIWINFSFLTLFFRN